jgi:hypothetical protein
MTCSDVEKHQFISASTAVTAGQLDGIAGIAEAHEVDALHHPSTGNIEARDQTQGDHGSVGKSDC